MPEPSHSHPLIQYLDNAPHVFSTIYTDGVGCLGIFRWLPRMAQYVVCKLLAVHTAVPWTTVESFLVSPQETLDRLIKWKVLVRQDRMARLNPIFQAHYIDLLTLNHPLFPDSAKSVRIGVELLARYGKDRWEGLLKYMLGDQQAFDHKMFGFLERSGLMARKDSQTYITNSGFQFVLQNTNTQTWTFLTSYIDQHHQSDSEKAELFLLLFKLGLVPMGTEYETSGASTIQKRFLEDMKNFGFVHQARGSNGFYPTALCRFLLSGTIANVEDALGNVGKGRGFIVVETNFHVYAYTTSELQISILSLFVKPNARFQNLVCGILTRESVQEAYSKGISSSQIIAYLSDNLKTESLPRNLIDQLKIWRDERNRLSIAPAVLYLQFLDHVEYDRLYLFAQDHQIVLLAHPHRRLLVVTQSGHSLVKTFLKSAGV